MEELSEIVKRLDLESSDDDDVDYEYIDVFRNPSNLPINQIHLEKTSVELRKDVPLEYQYNISESRCFNRKKQIVPALSRTWLPESLNIYNYQPYAFTATKDENSSFVKHNRLFLQTLRYLLKCNYHQFWCLVLFEPKVASSLHSFLLNPMLPHQIKYLGDEQATLYLSVLSQFRFVYQRLMTFQQSESEHMADAVGKKFLLDKNFLNLPIVLTLILLYRESHLDFVNDLVSLYFNDVSVFRDKEIEEVLKQVALTLEMIGGHVCGFEPGAAIVPIAVEARPPVFSSSWVHAIIEYLLSCISALHMLLKFHKPAVGIALSEGIPYRLSYTYEKVFHQIYEYIDGREELKKDTELSEIINEEIAFARSEFVDVYNNFVSYCVDKTLEFSNDPLKLEEHVEMYLQLMTTALEDEYFICDYHERYDVAAQNEMFSSCTNIDQTRTDYILSCISCLRRHNRLWKTLKTEPRTLHKARKKYASSRCVKDEVVQMNGEGEAEDAVSVNHSHDVDVVSPSEEQIEESVRSIIDMFPHLGDGFVLRCLEAYNYQANDVIGAILEDNLSPHLNDIPFDTIRIPPEPKPAEPILAYRGKKSDYDDALHLLNDKKEIKEIKTFIMDGIQYGNEYDCYDDEYDDRIEEATVPVSDHGTEDILKYNPNYEDVVSDTSYSENEYDEEGEAVATSSNDRRRAKGDFCEDPAKIRERNEARRRNQHHKGKLREQNPSKNDVVGKAKGQGQDKNVLHNRQRKNINKSSKGNHSRKSGAQWKRSKGMIPS